MAVVRYDVAPDFRMPDLRHCAPVVETGEIACSRTFHDTAGLDLLAFGLTLGCEDGWLVETPAGDIRCSGPDELLAPFLRGRPVGPVARLDTAGTRHRLCDGDGALLAEVVDTAVRATGLGLPIRAPRWREVTVQAFAPEFAATVDGALLSAGAVPATGPVGLARAVRGVAPDEDRPPLQDYVARQVDALVGAHFTVHRDEPDAVHQARVACRRIRSTLRTFADWFAPQPATELDAELAWYAGVLGAVRDLEVVRARIASALAELPGELVVGPVAEHIDHRLAGDQAACRADLLDAMAGERYAALLATLAGWRGAPPIVRADPLDEAVERAQRKLAKRLSRALGPGGTDAAMHRARKAGKRARYAAELLADATLVRRIAALQDVLGEFQDSVVAAQLLRRLAGQAAERGEDGFTYGVLVAGERERAARARRRARRF